MQKAITARLRCCQAAIVGLLLFFMGAAAAQNLPSAPPPRQSGSGPANVERKSQALTDRYEIEIAFEPQHSFLRAQAAVTLHAGAALRDLEMDLNPHLEIKSVRDAKGRP